jgi:hypothetical protein
MTERYELVEGTFAHVTPAGAWQAVQRRDLEPPAALARTILSFAATPELTRAGLAAWVSADADPMATLWTAQRRGWIEGLDRPRQVDEAPLEDLLPNLLGVLASSGRVALADEQGFCLDAVGFERPMATELSAVSADVASLQERHAGNIVATRGDVVGAWALVDEVGNSRIGFWPLHIGEQRFVLVAEGLPYFHHPCLQSLVWVLSTRYGAARTTGPALATGT